MLKVIARYILRKELQQIYASSTLQQTLLSQWKYSARVWEQYAKAFVPDSAPTFDEWFMRAVPKQHHEKQHHGKESLT
jgi:hypothetical protein